LNAEQPIANYNGNPQIEDGYTKIANELLEAITSYDFSKRQLKVLLFIIRKTYGFNKKTDQMSISQISKATGLEHSATVKTISELISIGVVSKQHGQYAQVIGINKQYDSWGVVSKQHPSVNSTPSVKTTIKGVSKQHFASVKITPTKETTKQIPKESKKTSLPKDFCISERVIKWANENGHTNLNAHFENFVIAVEAGGLKYSNWDSGFMRAIRDNWAKVPVIKQKGIPEWAKGAIGS